MSEPQPVRDAVSVPGVGLVTLADVEAERVAWWWPGRLPYGKVVVVDGDPGLGKSTVLLDLAARLTTGTPMPDGYKPTSTSVVIMSAEDGIADTIRPRLDAAGANAEPCTRCVSVLDEETQRQRLPSIPADLGKLEKIITATGAGVVIVDVLAAYLGSSVDSYRDQDVRRALYPISEMAARTGACVIVLRHLNKAGGTNPLYRGGGSIGIIGAARVGMLIAPDPTDETGERRVLAVTKCNIASEAESLAYHLVPDELHGCAHV